MTTLNKPDTDPQGIYRYGPLMGYLEAKFGFKSTDYFDIPGHYHRWCEKHGKRLQPGCLDENQRIFKEFSKAPDGAAAEPPRANFWHWMLDLVQEPGSPVKLPTSYKLNIPKLLAAFDRTPRDAEGTRSARLREQVFAKDILAHIEAEFGPVVTLNLRPQ